MDCMDWTYIIANSLCGKPSWELFLGTGSVYSSWNYNFVYCGNNLFNGTPLEADKQQHLENSDRDYKQMNEYYQHAKKLYEKQKNEDMEMQALELQMQDVIDGGWLD